MTFNDFLNSSLAKDLFYAICVIVILLVLICCVVGLMKEVNRGEKKDYCQVEESDALRAKGKRVVQNDSVLGSHLFKQKDIVRIIQWFNLHRLVDPLLLDQRKKVITSN